MPEFECPHPDCEDRRFDTEGGMKTHYGMQHEGSLAKKTTTCSTDGCTNEFEYYPSEKSGELCEDCTKKNNYDVTKYDTEYVTVDCHNCGEQKSITKTHYNKYENHFCGRECKYASSRTEITCRNCGDNQTVQNWKADRGRKFCGYECYIDSHRKEIDCSYCGDSTEIVLSRFEHSRKHFCDNSCYQKYRVENGNVDIECDNCGDSMTRTKYRADSFSGNFCSDKCQMESMKNRESVVCSECDTVFQKRPSEIKRTENHFCSKPCRFSFYRNAESLDSYGVGWKPTRETVRERDNFECQICGKKKKDLGQHPSAHHITPIKKFTRNGHQKEDAHYKENLVLLCEHHHSKVEYGIIELEEHIDDELVENLELENPIEMD